MTLKELVMKVDFDSLIRNSGEIDIWITSTPSVRHTIFSGAWSRTGIIAGRRP